MKIFIAFVLSLFISFSCMHAQESAKPNSQDTKPSVSDTVKNAETEPVYPDEDDFVLLDVEPYIDMEELHSHIDYAEFAKYAALEGKVIIIALINEKGEIVKYRVKHFDSEILNKFAIDALKKTRNIKPAYLNYKPISVWINIPIIFKVVDTKE